MNWSSQSLGTRLQHVFIWTLMRWRLTWFARLIVKGIVCYYSFLPGIRKRCYPYLMRRFPGSSSFQLMRHCQRLYSTFAEVLFARTLAGILGENPPYEIAQKTRERIEEEVRSTGLIVLTAHFGAWQIALHGLESFQKPINIVQWISKGDVDKHYFEHKSQCGKHAVRVIDSHNGIQASFDIITALKRGEIICTCGDRVTDSDAMSFSVSFLQGVIRVPMTSFLLASMANVPVLLTFNILDHGTVRNVCSEIIHVPQGLRHSPEQLLPYAQKYVDALEKLVFEYPYNFFNFYDMWSHDDTR